MEAPKTIAHEIGGVRADALRFGLQGVKSEIVGSHPLESAYQSLKDNQEEMKRRMLANTYGSAFPLKMELDRQILSRFQRPPGPIPSSMLGLEALNGSLDEFGFEDCLNGKELYYDYFTARTVYMCLFASIFLALFISRCSGKLQELAC